MNPVNETLQDLLERRLREMGQRRGRGEDFSLREVWLRLPEDDNGSRAVSYETVRRIRELGHNKIGDATADALATMLDVDVNDVLQAAGQRPRQGPHKLPSRAQRLTDGEWSVVLGVVDAILDAAGAERDDEHAPGPEPTVAGVQRERALRAVASEGDSGDAEKVDELARKARERQGGDHPAD